MNDYMKIKGIDLDVRRIIVVEDDGEHYTFHEYIKRIVEKTIQ